MMWSPLLTVCDTLLSEENTALLTESKPIYLWDSRINRYQLLRVSHSVILFPSSVKTRGAHEANQDQGYHL